MSDDFPEVAAPESTQHSFPWPPPEGASVVEAFVNTWRASVFQPTAFFRRMPREADYGAVIVYYLVVSVVAAGCQLFWHMVLPPVSYGPLLEFMKQQESAAGAVVSFLITPVLALSALYIVAGVTHVMLLLVHGEKHGFDPTTRAVAFSHGPALFAIVPYLGNFVAFFWTILLVIIGLREAHETSTGKAATAVLVPLFLLVVLGVLVTLAVLAMGLLETRL